MLSGALSAGPPAQFWIKQNNNYTVSKKTTLMLHTITSIHINWFWWFLAEMLPKKSTLSNGYLLSHLSSLMSLHYLGKHEHWKLSFQLCCKACLKNDGALACYIFLQSNSEKTKQQLESSSSPLSRWTWVSWYADGFLFPVFWRTCSRRPNSRVDRSGSCLRNPHSMPLTYN